VKQVIWLGDSLARLRDFPREARHEAGVQLGLVQAGEEPSDWKPMPAVGLGVNEIRVRAGGAFRVIYVAKFVEAVYVLHAFEKKSRKTARKDLELARRRFRSLVQDRRQQWPIG
jgi:phage-related protein